MSNENALTPFTELACCPELATDPICDVIDNRRRLVYPTRVRAENGQMVRVEVIIHTRFSRCEGPMALGDLVYTTTLLPGEKVRLTTTDRRSRFSFDSETNLSYYSEQVSESQYRMTAMRAFMADENVVDRGEDRASSSSQWDFHGDASGSIGFFSASADTNARGSHNAQSTRDWMREHKSHVEMSDNQSVEVTRKAHSLSIGEVATRAHQEGETEDHFEASSRQFSNPNKCHAVTFLFYRINKTETVKFELVSIERRVLDPVAALPVPANPIKPLGQVATIPQEVPANKSNRLEVEARAIDSEVLQSQAVGGIAGIAARATFATAVRTAPAPEIGTQEPLSKKLREQALKEVDSQLVEEGLLDEVGGQASEQIRQEIGYQRTTSLPTAGVIVKGCLDDCGVCEPELQQQMKLELQRMELENKLLERQIELLDKSQEYRCCPEDEGEQENDG